MPRALQVTPLFASLRKGAEPGWGWSLGAAKVGTAGLFAGPGNGPCFF